MANQAIPDSQLPLVSVITPIYKTGKWALEAIDSVMNQDYPADKIEYFIINDCTPDDSFELVKAHVKKKGYKVHFVDQDQNRGICGTVNHFLELCQGEYIQFNGDDVFLPHKTRSQVEMFLSLPEYYAVVYSDATLIDDESQSLFGTFIGRLRDSVQFPDDNVLEELLKGSFLCAPATMIKRSAIEEVGHYDEALSFEDYDMFLRLARKFKFKFQKEVTTLYRIRGGSETTLLKGNRERRLKRMKEYFLIYQKHFDLKDKQLRRIVRRNLFSRIVSAYKIQDPDLAEKISVFEAEFGSLGLLGRAMKMGLPDRLINLLFLRK